MSRTVVEIQHLGGVRLPADTADPRRHIRPESARTPAYLAGYDRHTLIYDAVRLPGGECLITAPPFLNLWPVFRDTVRINGQRPRRLRRRRSAKYEQVEIPGPVETLDLLGQPVPLRPSLAARFKGLNAAVTMNRDNHLDWISEWAAYHGRVHGMQGVVIFDNGSTAYTPDALAAHLTEHCGMQMVAVISAPFPYGTNEKGPPGSLRPKFLQPALLNLARREVLSEARAVLNADIDEIVWDRGAGSVFDRAAAHPHRPVLLPGQWAFPAPGTEGPSAQWAHVMRADPPRRSNRKWCAVPSGWPSRLGWHVHHVAGEVFKYVAQTGGTEVVHCRATSTGWKGNDRYDTEGVLVRDEALAAMMSAQFPVRP